MKKNKYIVARKIHDCYFLINIHDDYIDEKCRLYEINETGFYIWNEMDHCDNVNELVEGLLKVIVDEVDRRDIDRDVKNFVEILEKKGFIEV